MSLGSATDRDLATQPNAVLVMTTAASPPLGAHSRHCTDRRPIPSVARPWSPELFPNAAARSRGGVTL